MKSSIETQGPQLAESVIGSNLSMPPEVAQFNEAWSASMDVFGGAFAPAAPTMGPSTLSQMSVRQAELLQSAYTPLDVEQLSKMSVIKVTETLTNQKVSQDIASTMMTVQVSAMKTMRQAVDTVMNSK